MCKRWWEVCQVLVVEVRIDSHIGVSSSIFVRFALTCTPASKGINSLAHSSSPLKWTKDFLKDYLLVLFRGLYLLARDLSPWRVCWRYFIVALT